MVHSGKIQNDFLYINSKQDVINLTIFLLIFHQKNIPFDAKWKGILFVLCIVLNLTKSICLYLYIYILYICLCIYIYIIYLSVYICIYYIFVCVYMISNALIFHVAHWRERFKLLWIRVSEANRSETILKNCRERLNLVQFNKIEARCMYIYIIYAGQGYIYIYIALETFLK